MKQRDVDLTHVIMRSDQAVVIFKLVLGPGLAGPNQWQSMAAWCNACLPALAVDKPLLSSKRIICSCLHNVNTYGSRLLNLAVVRPLVGSGATNCHNMLVLGAKLLLSSMQSIVRLVEHAATHSNANSIASLRAIGICRMDWHRTRLCF